MKIIRYNEEKRAKILENPDRKIDLQIVALMINEWDILDIRPSPNYPNQKVYIIKYNDYTCAVPFVETEKEIFLKTVFPSRALHKIYSKYF